MQWKQIKMLFILCFLVLNVYLLFMFFNKQEESDFGYENPDEVTLEQELESEDITISTDLSQKEINESYITAGKKTFTDKELDYFSPLENQNVEILNQTFIISRFKEPVSVPDDAKKNTISQLVKSKILLPDNYTFGSWNKSMNTLVFFQKKKDHPIYYNQSGIIIVYLNDDNEMMFYTQTMLGKAAPSTNKKKTLIKQMDAIKVLYEGNKIWPGDDITDVKLGFHTRFPLPNGKQVFAPTWIVSVNEDKHFSVNALENLVVQNDETSFLVDAVAASIEKVKNLPDDNDMKKYVLKHMNERVNRQ
ncbi:two-component system regulatory protein YycI [Lentibacillus halophilus]|uniref:Two-component system regulatory protein YycI n=1 Tax=Lentibacillus halophilus TaxID=295065 RepID=A0ABN0Z7K7_9BACI